MAALAEPKKWGQRKLYTVLYSLEKCTAMAWMLSRCNKCSMGMNGWTPARDSAKYGSIKSERIALPPSAKGAKGGGAHLWKAVAVPRGGISGL
jgi:hypothetical protein